MPEKFSLYTPVDWVYVYLNYIHMMMLELDDAVDGNDWDRTRFLVSTTETSGAQHTSPEELTNHDDELGAELYAHWMF